MRSRLMGMFESYSFWFMFINVIINKHDNLLSKTTLFLSIVSNCCYFTWDIFYAYNSCMWLCFGFKSRAGCLVFKLSSNFSFAFSTLRGRPCNACIVLIDLKFSQGMSQALPCSWCWMYVCCFGKQEKFTHKMCIYRDE